jgi:hypothetical protein
MASSVASTENPGDEWKVEGASLAGGGGKVLQGGIWGGSYKRQAYGDFYKG